MPEKSQIEFRYSDQTGDKEKLHFSEYVEREREAARTDPENASRHLLSALCAVSRSVTKQGDKTVACLDWYMLPEDEKAVEEMAEEASRHSVLRETIQDKDFIDAALNDDGPDWIERAYDRFGSTVGRKLTLRTEEARYVTPPEKVGEMAAAYREVIPKLAAAAGDRSNAKFKTVQRKMAVLHEKLKKGLAPTPEERMEAERAGLEYLRGRKTLRPDPRMQSRVDAVLQGLRYAMPEDRFQKLCDRFNEKRGLQFREDDPNFISPDRFVPKASPSSMKSFMRRSAMLLENGMDMGSWPGGPLEDSFTSCLAAIVATGDLASDPKGGKAHGQYSGMTRSDLAEVQKRAEELKKDPLFRDFAKALEESGKLSDLDARSFELQDSVLSDWQRVKSDPELRQQKTPTAVK